MFGPGVISATIAVSTNSQNRTGRKPNGSYLPVACATACLAITPIR